MDLTPAGTGKSVLLREIISGLRKKFIREPDRVAVTASTGLAACNIGGVTIHSFAGIGLGKEPAEDLVKKIRRNAKAKQRWMRTKVLIVDEVSMVDGDLFDKLEQIARTIRNNGRPFGGIQLIITGDFFQLPPVPEFGKPSRFAFDAGTWTTSIEHTIGLHHVFRQKDPVFAGMLNEMREGRMSNESIANFRKLERPLPASEGNIEATELFLHVWKLIARIPSGCSNCTATHSASKHEMEVPSLTKNSATDYFRIAWFQKSCI